LEFYEHLGPWGVDKIGVNWVSWRSMRPFATNNILKRIEEALARIVLVVSQRFAEIPYGVGVRDGVTGAQP
jgi:hypothetical protein